MRRERSRELHAAAGRGDLAAVREALDAGADVNARDDRCGTPLGEAAHSQSREVVDLLLRHGARHTLHTLAYLGDAAAIEARLAAGACADERDHRSNTPLHCAASNDHVETAALLLDHGAEITLTRPRSRSARPGPPRVPLDVGVFMPRRQLTG